MIVRLSDFKSNEYANLVGGERYEPEEENPMLRIPRRRTLRFRKLPRLLRSECEAMKRVRNDMGLTNVEVMVPFVRTVAQAKAVARRAGTSGTRSAARTG